MTFENCFLISATLAFALLALAIRYGWMGMAQHVEKSFELSHLVGKKLLHKMAWTQFLLLLTPIAALTWVEYIRHHGDLTLVTSVFVVGYSCLAIPLSIIFWKDIKQMDPLAKK